MEPERDKPIMKVLETDYWCLILPVEWAASHEENSVRIVDQDDVGELVITALCKESGEVTPDELVAMATEESPEVETWSAATTGAFNGVTGFFSESDASIREWYVGAGSVLLYMSYLCHEDDAGLDDASVDEILNTLVLGDSAS